MNPTDEPEGIPTEELLSSLYQELRDMAARFMRSERQNHTLQPTALVNEVYLRLASLHTLRPKDKNHLMSLAAQAMRRILVDHARRRKAAKRGGGAVRVTFNEELLQLKDKNEVDILDLNTALEKLEELSARQASVVELRFFGGLSVLDTAEVLEVSPTTVKSDTKFAIAWLRQQLSEAGHN